MDTPHLNFESFDGGLRRAAENALGSLRELGGPSKPVPVTLDPQIAAALARFLDTALERGGVAYGPLGTELSHDRDETLDDLSDVLSDDEASSDDLPERP